jgi:peptide chain release factor 1
MVVDRLEAMEKRYNEITELLSTPEIASDIEKLKSLSKEQSSLQKPVELFNEYKSLESSLDDLKEMSKGEDQEMALMAQEELESAKKRMQEIDDEMVILLMPKDPNDEKNVIMEIRGAVGGDEANIFAGDLFRMYSKYAESKGWKVQIMDAMPSAMGGYSSIQAKISGESVYSQLKFESGGHRVQRIPVTEANGRIQTSIATVLVMPEAEEIDFQLDEKDLRIDTMCASGPGGQGVNTTYSAVRVTYIPTGDFVACQVARSQHENKAMAMEILRTRIYQRMKAEEDEKNGATRQSLIGHGERSEKIRTYNYPQNRVTDHRIGFTINRLDAIIDGKLDLVIQELINEDQKRKLEASEA